MDLAVLLRRRRRSGGLFSKIPQWLHNGLTEPDDSYTGGALYLPDDDGVLRTAGTDELGIKGRRFDDGQFLMTDALGDPLFTSISRATKAGTVLDYSVDPTWSGMEVWPARTNLLTWSEAFDNAAWVKNEVVVTANNAVAPDGTLTADLVIPNEGTVNARVYRVSGTNGVNRVYTFFVKSAGIRYLNITTSGSSYASVFDLVDGVALSPSVSSPAPSTIKNEGNGWWRISHTTDVGSQLNIVATTSYTRVGSTATDTFNGTDGFYIWGGQTEDAVIFPSPYIPTTDATVTRAATVASFTSAGKIREQNCAVWGTVIPGAGGQSDAVALLGVDGVFSVNTGSTGTIVDLYVSAVKRSFISYTHAANVPFEYQAFWSDKGMAIRVREYTSGAWQAWSAWATNANADPAPIAATLGIGHRAGIGQFAAAYPRTMSAFLPTFDTLAEYQTYVQTEANWGIIT